MLAIILKLQSFLAPNGFANGPPSYGGQPDYTQPPAYHGGMYPGLPNGQQNYPGTQPSYPGAQPGYPGAQPSYPGAHSNYPGNQPGPQPGYPQWGNPGFQQSSSDGYSGTVVNNGPGYPNNSGAGGAGPSAPICKLISFDFDCHKFYIEYRFSF